MNFCMSWACPGDELVCNPSGMEEQAREIKMSMANLTLNTILELTMLLN